MQFELSNNKKKPAASLEAKKVEGKLVKPTWEDAFKARELCDRCTVASNKAIALVDQQAEVFASLTIAQLKKESGALESLGAENLKALAAAFGTTEAGLEAMTVKDFAHCVNELMPKSHRDAEPGQELLGEAVVAGTLISLWIALVGGALYYASKMTKYEKPYMIDNPGTTIKEKAKQAMTDIGLNSFSAKEFASQIKACNEILKFLDQDMKKFFAPEFKVVEIEKQANKLWGSSESFVVATHENADGAYDVWWRTWRDNQPKREFKTLGEHGFTPQSLSNTWDDLVALAKELSFFGSKYGRIVDGKLEAKKNEPGFFGKIKRIFTESVEDREKRKHAELILNAKEQGLKNLLWGVDWCAREMFSEFIDLAVKMEKYLDKTDAQVEKKAAAKKAAAPKK